MGGNPVLQPGAMAIYVRVYCSAASTIPGSGVQASFTWNDASGNPQEHDTVISLDTLGTSSIPESFMVSLAANPEQPMLQATIAGDGEFTIEYANATLYQFAP